MKVSARLASSGESVPGLRPASVGCWRLGDPLTYRHITPCVPPLHMALSLCVCLSQGPLLIRTPLVFNWGLPYTSVTPS